MDAHECLKHKSVVVVSWTLIEICFTSNLMVKTGEEIDSVAGTAVETECRGQLLGQNSRK